MQLNVQGGGGDFFWAVGVDRSGVAVERGTASGRLLNAVGPREYHVRVSISYSSHTT